METKNSDYLKELEEILNMDYLTSNFDDLIYGSNIKCFLSEDNMTRLKEKRKRINDLLGLQSLINKVRSNHLDIEALITMQIPNDYKLDSFMLFQKLTTKPQFVVNRIIRFMDNDNASILKDINEAIKNNDFEYFHQIIKAQNINTAYISKALSFYEEITNFDCLGDYMVEDDELKKKIIIEQMQNSINKLNNIQRTSPEFYPEKQGLIQKFSFKFLSNNKQVEITEIPTYLTNLGDKIIEHFDRIIDAKSFDHRMEELNKFIEEFEPLILKTLAILIQFCDILALEKYIIFKALENSNLTSKFNDIHGELKEAFESYMAIEVYGKKNTFSVPSDIFSNIAYIREEGADNHFDGVKLVKTIGTEELEKLINYLAIHNYIGNCDTEKYRFLYFLTGREVNTGVDYTGMLLWNGEATVIYNIVKNLYSGKGHYQRVQELVNFTSDKIGAERLEKQHIEKASGMSGVVDNVADDDYKRFVSAAFKWTFKGDLKK